MASITQWLSVVRKPAVDGDATIVLASRNRDPEITVTVTAALTAGMDEISTARAINLAINARLAVVERNYIGAPSFDYTNPPTFLLRSRYTGHLINVWSQAEFEIRSVTVPDGCIVHAGLSPIFSTLKDMDTFAVSVGANFRSSDGTCLSDDARVGLLLSGSAELISIADGFFIVAAQYLHEESRNYFRGWNLEHYPIIAFDSPMLRGDSGINYTLTGGYEVSHYDGTVKIIVAPSPITYKGSKIAFDLKHSYVAGLSHIHELLKIETVRFAGVSMWPANISEVKRGSGSVKLTDAKDLRAQFRTKLNGIIN